jgi:hypothetical protein
MAGTISHVAENEDLLKIIEKLLETDDLHFLLALKKEALKRLIVIDRKIHLTPSCQIELTPLTRRFFSARIKRPDAV